MQAPCLQGGLLNIGFEALDRQVGQPNRAKARQYPPE